MPAGIDSGVLLNLDPTLTVAIYSTVRAGVVYLIAQTDLGSDTTLCSLLPGVGGDCLELYPKLPEPDEPIVWRYPGDQGKGPEPELLPQQCVPCRWANAAGSDAANPS